MILVDLFNLQKENKEKYNFVIYFKDNDIINTSVKITFSQLKTIIGLSLEYNKIEYTVSCSNVVMIEIKDS
jgi:hypothetical protein